MSTGSAVKVGIIDVGVTLDHPAFGGTATTGADFVDGDSVAILRIRFGITRYSQRGTATSAIWNVPYFACRTTLAPISISFFGNAAGRWHCWRNKPE